MKLVVVADDFGLCESVNNGIVAACTNGIVTELSLMLGSPGTEHAVRLAGSRGIANVGIHMLLKNWRDTGALVRRADYIRMFDGLSQSDVAQLVMAELEEFERVVGHKPTHITSQFGIIAHPKAISAVIEYALENDIPMRQPVMTLYGDEPELDLGSLRLMQKQHVRTTDYFFARIMEPDYGRLIELYEHDLAVLQNDETAELALHPGVVDDDLRSMTSLVEERARDLRLAIEPDFREWLDERGIAVVGYGDVVATRRPLSGQELRDAVGSPSYEQPLTAKERERLAARGLL